MAVEPTTAEGGVLLIDKPAGLTSHDVVNRLRRSLGIRRVGHTGTLDPFATGLLLICYGAATRLADYFHLLDKSYDARLRLGIETATHDHTGEFVSRSEAWATLDASAIEAALQPLMGDIDQRPPAFSAKKVAGERAYRRARAGKRVDLPPAHVRVEGLTLTEWSPPEAGLHAVVSTGTYIRLSASARTSSGCGARRSVLSWSGRPWRRTMSTSPGEVPGTWPRRRRSAGCRTGVWIVKRSMPWCRAARSPCGRPRWRPAPAGRRTGRSRSWKETGW